MGTNRRGAALAVGLTLALLVASAGVAAAQSSDPLREFQWGLEQVNAPQAWAQATGEGVTIAMIDTGIDPDHEDLEVNAVPGATFLDCGDDGCGTGHWLDHGGEGADPDADPHGTHVAGIAAALAGNGVGVAGVAQDATIMPIKALNFAGGTAEDVVRGIRYAIDNGADVINMSLGTLPGTQLVPITPELEAAVADAHEAGIVLVAAGGNFTSPLCEDPAFMENVICVVATTQAETKATYSNLALSEDPNLLALAAPGGELSSLLVCAEGVLSTMPAGEGQSDCEYPEAANYGELEGTSMAAPHVAGVAALLLEHGCDREGAIEAMVETARTPPTGERGTWDPVYGYGIVDAAGAVDAADAICLGLDGDGDADGGTDGGTDTDSPAPTLGSGAPAPAPDDGGGDDTSGAPSSGSNGTSAGTAAAPSRSLPSTGGGAALGSLGVALGLVLLRGRRS